MQIMDLPAPWRHRLMPASFKGAQYHVEQQGRISGRRIVLHEYPKRETPYAEDMGRAAIRYQVVGYVIGPNYHVDKDFLISKLESEGPGTLVDPYLPTNSQSGYSSRSIMFSCERYSVTEGRERGGYAAFEMVFVEAGVAGNSVAMRDTAATVRSSAEATSDVAAGALDRVGAAL